MEKDRVFARKQDKIQPFAFTREVARVFDDMLVRSVPLYREGILRQAHLAERFFMDNTRIFDLGCSHGNFGVMLLDRFGTRPFDMVAVDSSWPMVEKYKKRLAGWPHASKNISLVCASLEDVRIENASVVIINLTLQFLDETRRDELIQRIYQGLAPGGILLLTEKTRACQPVIDQTQVEVYRQFKLENGYSELEISQKRDALEKVLVPDTVQTHLDRLGRAGFLNVDIWLKWFNFASFMAVK